MKLHIKIYRNHFDVGEQDQVLCTLCECVAVDVHHIYLKGMGGRRNFTHEGETIDINDIRNLIALDRACHDKAHKGEISKDILWHAQKLKLKGIKNFRYE